MKSSYLFFDIECANCFEGVGKICSFGYVLTDSDFNILETDDLVMNPECEFDWFLFSNRNGAKLAYPREYFRKQPNFLHFYEHIKELLTAENRKSFIFGSISDIGFVVTAIERYKQEWIDFCAYDLEKIIKKDNEIFGSLEARCTCLGIDNTDLQAHKSQDDSIMTMRLLKEFCAQKNVSVDDLIQANQDFLYTAKDFLKVREIRLKKKARKAARAAGKTAGKKPSIKQS